MNDLLPFSAPPPIAYSIADAARAVGMSQEAFKKYLVSGDITRRYPNSKPIVLHSDLVEWAGLLPVDKPLPK
ncbi:hypothetical protein [Cryobacterium roopkundense]|uniref:Helix-turn-helix domain-containing protein n=1 Tax=Cryobacterium roopkundense TaxID=1001240 RepID=A0A7W8ZXH5_9MICO|nr:hypothetical protein [Cryobacterium roopkundense]MBB5641792.1 hypothetical protein [Cryobacterium roopkundense]